MNIQKECLDWLEDAIQWGGKPETNLRICYAMLDILKSKMPPYAGLWFYEKDGTFRPPTTKDI